LRASPLLFSLRGLLPLSSLDLGGGSGGSGGGGNSEARQGDGRSNSSTCVRSHGLHQKIGDMQITLFIFVTVEPSKCSNVQSLRGLPVIWDIAPNPIYFVLYSDAFATNFTYITIVLVTYKRAC
jgi:hypothetical protein